MVAKVGFWRTLRDAIRTLASLQESQRRLEANVQVLIQDTEFLRRRLSSYVGSGRAITYLDDEMPIFVNSNDFGPPANFIVGGVYEQDNLDVLMSFVHDDTVFLDVGANLGFFSLKIGGRLRHGGRVHAFEPNPELAALFRGSVYINGLGNFDGSGLPILIHEVALGNCDEQVNFQYPEFHLGGGARTGHDSSQPGVISVGMRKLDTLLGENFTFDLAKIDVEGGELDVIKGLRGGLLNSPHAKILFEKFGINRGNESQIEREFSELGFSIYSVLPSAELSIVQPGKFVSSEGYFLACRPSELLEQFNRSFFKIFPKQLFVSAQANSRIDGGTLYASADRDVILFHGPYWHLRRGSYRVDIDATIDGRVRVAIAQRFGHVLDSFVLKESIRTFYFVAERDLMHFECVAYADGSRSSIELRWISFTRLG